MPQLRPGKGIGQLLYKNDHLWVYYSTTRTNAKEYTDKKICEKFSSHIRNFRTGSGTFSFIYEGRFPNIHCEEMRERLDLPGCTCDPVQISIFWQCTDPPTSPPVKLIWGTIERTSCLYLCILWSKGGYYPSRSLSRINVISFFWYFDFYN